MENMEISQKPSFHLHLLQQCPQHGAGCPQLGTTEGHHASLLLSRIKVLSHALFQAGLFLPGSPGSMEKVFFFCQQGHP